MSNHQVRVGVIGCGYWGPNLVRNFVELPGSDVVAVADYSEDRRAYIHAKYPTVTTAADYTALFSMDLDAVVVATPPTSHYPIAKDCIEHGLHVLVEKPLTTSAHDAEDLVDSAEAQGVVLMVGHTFEYNPAVQMLKSIIASGELGEIYYISTARLNLGLFQRDLNVIWDLAPHDISILNYLLDSQPVTVSAHGGYCIFKHICDIAFLCLNFPNGVMAHARVSWLDPRKVRTVIVVGSQKMAVYDDVTTQEKIRIYDKGVDLPYTDTFGDFQLAYRYGDVVAPYIHFHEPLRKECEHFLECINNGHEPQSNGRVGLNVIRTIEAAQWSLQNNGQPQNVPEIQKVYAHGA